jgi:hypothetical protein
MSAVLKVDAYGNPVMDIRVMDVVAVSIPGLVSPWKAVLGSSGSRG